MEVWLMLFALEKFWICSGVQQTETESFDSNGEPSLDLQYGMALVTSAQNVTLYQVGDLVEGNIQ